MPGHPAQTEHTATQGLPEVTAHRATTERPDLEAHQAIPEPKVPTDSPDRPALTQPSPALGVKSDSQDRPARTAPQGLPAGKATPARPVPMAVKVRQVHRDPQALMVRLVRRVRQVLPERLARRVRQVQAAKPTDRLAHPDHRVRLALTVRLAPKGQRVLPAQMARPERMAPKVRRGRLALTRPGAGLGDWMVLREWTAPPALTVRLDSRGRRVRTATTAIQGRRGSTALTAATATPDLGATPVLREPMEAKGQPVLRVRTATTARQARQALRAQHRRWPALRGLPEATAPPATMGIRVREGRRAHRGRTAIRVVLALREHRGRKVRSVAGRSRQSAHTASAGSSREVPRSRP